MKLSKITNIQTGIFQKTEPLGEVLYLQARHFDISGNYITDSQPECIDNHQLQKHILNDGDILFAAKGSRNFAAVYRSDIGVAVASSSLMVIRINDSALSFVLPDYLQWYLNSIEGQAFLKNNAKGTAVLSIPIPVLQEMDIPIPEIRVQKMLISIQSLSFREHQLQTEINNLKKLLLQRQLLSIIK